MAKRGEEHISPETARYYPIDFKKVLPFIVVILFVGLVLLILFTGDGKKQVVKNEDKNPVNPVQTESTENFDKQLGRKLSENKLNKLETTKSIPKPKVQPSNYKDRRDAIEKALKRKGGGGSSGEKSILQEHRDNELKRALNSGKNDFNIGSLGDGLQIRQKNIDADPVAAVKKEAALAQNRYLEALNDFKNGNTNSPFQTGADTPFQKTIQPQKKATDKSLLEGTSAIPAFPDGYAGSNATYYAQKPNGTKTIMAGTVIPIVLETKIVSDYVGQVKARISRDVYSSDKASVIIPAGSVVLAKSSRLGNVNEAINNRLAITVPTIIRPDGLKIDLTDLSLLDSAGVGGIKGSTNYHFVAQALATVAYAGVVGLGSDIFTNQLGINNQEEQEQDRIEVVNTTTTTTTTSVDSEGNETTNTVVVNNQEPFVLGANSGNSISVSSGNDSQAVRAQIAGDFAKKLADVFQPIIDKYFSLVPTVTIKAGTRMNLIIEKDIYASPWSNIYEEFN